MIIPPIRTSDRFGQGHYLASRGSRVHRGVDFVVEPGQPIFCDVNGTVTRHGYPYRNNFHFKLLEIRVDPQTKVKYMYIAPTVGAMSLVHVGQKIGITQDLDSLHKGITPHIHFEVWVEGEHVNPVLWLRNYHEGLYDGKSTN